MSFFENNRERVRSDLLKLLHDEDEPAPCSKNNNVCDTDSEESYVEELLNDTDNVFKSLKKKDTTDTEKSKDEEQKDLETSLKIDNFSLFEEDEDEFIKLLIDQNLADNDNVSKTFIDEKPYKIEITSSFEPDDEYEEPKKKTSDTCSTEYEYVEFDAFYENYISQMGDIDEHKQFEIFNDIILDNLTHSDDGVYDVVCDFRKNVVQEWIKNININGNEFITEPKKWVNRADTILYDMYQKQPLLDYVYHLAKLLILFDADKTFGLNEYMYIEIGNKALEPIDMKKYKLEDLMEHYTKGKAVSRILIQDVTDNIKIKQNIMTLNLSIKLYNQITDSNIKLMDECENSQELTDRVKDQLLQQQQHHLNLNRPIIYVEPKTKKIYVFDYRKLNDKFANGDKRNPYTNEEFCQEFIDLCSKKMKNHMLCVFCKDKLDEKNILKTIYLHPKYGPIILKFCNAVCMSDITWNNKSVQNAIIGIV
jgi:hypothetical protein